MKSFDNVLFVMVGGLDAIHSLKQVMLLAEKHQFDLTLLDVTESLKGPTKMLITAMSAGDLKSWVLHKRMIQLAALISMIKRPSCKLRARAAFGNSVDEIAREVLEGNFDLVIKPGEKGSTDRRLLKKCKCPVWVLQSDDYAPSGQLIAGNFPIVDSRKANQINRFSILDAS